MLSCAAALFQIKSPDNVVVHEVCQITYYEYLQPPPAILETQDEILLANLPPTWQLVCDNQIDRPIPLRSAIYAIVSRDDLCTCGILVQHMFLYESMHICANPDTSVQLYYTYNKALVSYDTSLTSSVKEQYYTDIPDYRAPDIFYARKSIQSRTSKLLRKQRDVQIQGIELKLNQTYVDSTPPNAQGSKPYIHKYPRNVVGRIHSNHRYHRSDDSEESFAQDIPTDDLLSFSIPLQVAVSYMETGNIYYLPPHTSQANDNPSSESITENMNFYLYIVTVVNFLTSITNGLILSLLYRNCQTLLSGILTSILQNLEEVKQAKALKLSNDELVTTDDPSTTDSSATETTSTKYTPFWIFLIVLLSMLVVFAIYWIIDLILVPLFRKSSTCRYLLPFHKSNNNYLTPATDIFMDIVHITTGEQIRVFLTTITAPPCSLSFIGSVRLTNFRLTRQNLLSTLHIDWHNCLLHYDNHVISLPSKGTALSFQPNLLTTFT